MSNRLNTLGRIEVDIERSFLTDAARNGTLTYALLSDMVKTYDRGNVYSIGGDWIRSHPQMFGALPINHEQFLLEHLLVRSFGESIIFYRPVLANVPSASIEGLVRTAILTTVAFTKSSSWVQVASSLGVPDQAIAEIIFEKLRTTPTNAGERFEVVSMFLRNAVPALGLDDPTKAMWSVFSNEQLREALRICLEVSPVNILRSWESIEQAVGEVEAILLANAAADRLLSVETLTIQTLRKLSLSRRMSLCRKIRGPVFGDENGIVASPELVVDTLTALRQHGGTFYQEIREVIDRLDAAKFFLACYRLADVPDWLKAVADIKLAQGGYKKGTIRSREHLSPRFRTYRIQWEVEADDAIYIYDRSDHRHVPRSGDKVIFDHKQARNLSWRDGKPVKLVHFTPINNDRE